MTSQFQRVRELIGRMSSGMQIVAAVLLVAVIAAVLFFATRSEPQRMEVAFSGLVTEDSARVADILRDNGIDYEVSSDGSTIRVPSDRVADVRLMAASEGLPEGGTVGFELFDSTSFGVTNFQQQVNYQRALEGELARTINRLDAVQSSRVMLAMPEETIFIDDQKPTTASAVLRLKSGATLPPDQLKGISHLIAGSVEGLDPADITIVSTDGTMLWDGEAVAQTPMAGLDDQFAAQRSYEASLQRSIQGIVERVVGPGGSSVTVNAVMDWDQRSVQNETFSPNGLEPQVRSEQETLRSSTNSTDGAGGVPGTDANIPTDQEPEEQAADDSTIETFRDTVTNYEISSSIESIVEAPGDVQQLSVAVVLDQERIDPEVVLTIEDLVRSAVGLEDARGDQLTVAAVPFSDAGLVADVPLPGESLLDRILPYATIAVMILIPAVLLFLLYRMLSKTDEEAVLAPVVLGDITPRPRATAGAGQQVDFRMEEVAPVELDQTVANPSARRQQILRLAENDPAQMSALVRSWLAEDNN